MSDTAASLRRKIASAGDLESVVRTMKAMAASSIGQYENAVRSLDDYYRTVQLGLAACFRQGETAGCLDAQCRRRKPGRSVPSYLVPIRDWLGSSMRSWWTLLLQTLDNLPGKKTVWAVGERIQSRLADTDLQSGEGFALPNSINAITPLVGQILIEMEAQREQGAITQVYLFHNRPKSGAIYTPVSQRLLPLDEPVAA